jgi:hypothetical protein
MDFLVLCEGNFCKQVLVFRISLRFGATLGVGVGGLQGRTWIGFLCLLNLRGDRVLGLKPT